jgi:CBS domain-containing protein
VLIASPGETVRAAARRMADAGVGTLVVLDTEKRPVGILTDRDVAVRCVAEGRDPDATSIASLMTAPVASVQESTPIEDALARMAGVGARRLAVVDGEGRLAGVLALDDVLELLAEEAATIGRLLAARARRR